MARSVILQLLADIKGFEQNLNRAASTANNTFGRIGQAAGKVGGALGSVSSVAGKLGSVFNLLGGSVLKNTIFFAGYFNALIAINSAMTGVIQHSLNLDEGLRKVQSITKDSNETIEELRNQLLDLARKGQLAGKSAADVAQAMFDIVQSGFSAAQALEIARVAAEAAAAGFTEADTAGKAIVSVLNAFQLPAEQARHVADILFKTVDVGVVTFEDLAQNIGDFIGTAAIANVSLEDLGAAMAVMTKRGIPAAEAATSLNRMMLQFIKPSEKAKEAAAGFGIELSADALAAKGLVGALLDIQEKTGGSAEAFGQIFDEVRGFRGATVLLTDDGKELVKVLEQMGLASAGSGALAEAFEIRAEALRFKLQRLGSQITALVEQNGSLAKTFGPIIDKISEFIASDSPLLQFIVNFVAGLATMMASVSGLTFLLKMLLFGLNPVTLALGVLAAILTALDIPFSRVIGAVKDFAKGLLDQFGILDRFRNAWADLQFAIEGFRAGNLTDAAIGIKLFLKNLLGIDVPIKDVRQKLIELRLAVWHVKRAFEVLREGDIEGFWLRIKWALEQAFGEDTGRKIFAVIKFIADFTFALGKAAFEIGKAVIKSELFKSFLEGLRIVIVKIIPWLAKMLKWILDHKPALIALTIALAALLIWLNPIPAAIIAIITAIGFLSRHWDEIKAKTMQIWNSIVNYLRGVWESIKRFFQQTFGVDIQAILRIAFDFYKNTFLAFFNFIVTQARLYFDIFINLFRFFKAILEGDWSAAWQALKNIFVAVWESIKNLLNFYLTLFRQIIDTGLRLLQQIMFTVWNNVKREAEEMWNLIKGVVGGAVDSIVAFFTALPGRLLGALGAIKDAGLSLGRAIKDGIVDGIKEFAGSVTGIVDSIKGALISAWNSIVQWLDDNIKIKIPGWNPPGPGSFPDIEWNPDFSGAKLAAGIRNFIGGLAMVGERGAEFVSLPRGTDVFPAATASRAGIRAAAQAAGAGPSVKAEVNINAGLLSQWEELKRLAMAEVERKLDDAAARAGLAQPRFGTFGAGVPRT